MYFEMFEINNPSKVLNLDLLQMVDDHWLTSVARCTWNLQVGGLSPKRGRFSKMGMIFRTFVINIYDSVGKCIIFYIWKLLTNQYHAWRLMTM